jgi:hypothetical protein
VDNEIEDFDTFFNRYTKSDSPDGGIAVADKKTSKKKDDEDSFETFFQKYTGQPATPELDLNVSLSRSEYKPVEPATIGSGPLGSGNFIKPAPSTHATEIDQFAGIPYADTEQREFARTLFKSYSDPEKLKEIQEKVPWYMPTDTQLKVLQTRDNERTTKQVLGDMASVVADVSMNAPGIVGDVLEGGYGIAKGLGKGALAGLDTLSAPLMASDARKAERSQMVDEGIRSGRVLADAALLTGEAITDSAKRMIKGGSSYMDWVLGKTGKRSEEELFNNYKARYAARVADNDAKEVNPAVLARFTKWLSNQQFYVPPEDIGYVDLPRPEEVAAMGTPVVRDLGAAIIGQFTPSIEERLARHNGDRAAAALEKQTEDMSAAGSMIDSAIENANRLVEDPKQIGFVQITTPLQEFAVAGMVAKGLGAGVKAGIQGIREAGKTAEEISALRSAAAASALGKTRDAAASLEKAGMLERPLEFLAKGIENVGEKGAKAFESLPEGVRPFVTHGAALAGLGGLGAGFGSLVDEEGAGVGLGLLGYGALKGPGIAANLLKARRMSAGKIGMLETAQMMPELRKATQRTAFVFGGKGGDFFINNSKDFLKNQIQMVPLAMALGVFNDQDAKGMVQTMAEGGVLALGHQLFAKALGKDPTAIERQRKARNIAAEKALIAASPEHRSNVDNLNWDRVVEQRQSMAQAMAEAHARAAAENPDSPQAQFLFSEKQRAQNLYQEALGASVETRKRFAEEMRGYFADAEAHVNGALSPGSNTKIEVLTSEQIKERLKNNNQAPLTPEQLEPYMSPGMRISGGRPTNRPWFGNLQDQIIINYDKLVKDARFSGDALPTVLSHEIGHDLWKRNEYKKLMMPVYIELFGNEVRDENGNVITGKAGAYSDELLFSMYGDKYLAGRTPEEVKEFAVASNLWDAENNTINKPAAVQYMKEEVLADANTGDLFAPPDSPLRSALKWAEAKATNAKLKNVLRALNTIGVDPFQAQTTGAVFSPEVRNMVREANRLIEKHNGLFEDVDPENPNPEPVITKKDILASRDLLQKVHSDSGKFVTTPSLVVIDADGTVIGKRPITTPNVFEGQWDYNADELGEVKATRKRGYGPLPPEAEGMNIPDGATVRVEREIAYGKDGKPIEKSNSETRDYIAARDEAIRAAIVGAADGTPGEVKPFTASGMSLRGKLTQKQRAAIMALPESMVSLTTKEKLFKVMDAIAKDDGSRLNVIYSARLNDRGGYTPFRREMRDFTPVSVTFSKDGHFLANTFSVSGLNRKLKLWEQHMPGKFAPWNGNMEAFKSDFQKYLRNWEPIWEDADGNRRPRPGQSELDANQEIAIAKKNVFNDLIGVSSEEYNPERSELPRKKFTSAQRKRAKQSDPNTIFRSYRLDAMEEVPLDSPTTEKYRIDYGLAKINFMPEGAEGVEGVEGIRDVNTAAEERPEARGTTILSSNPNATNAIYVPPTNEGVRFRPEGTTDPTMIEDGLYSQAGRVLLNKMPNRASAAQLKGILDPQKGSGVKPEELKWSGINQFIDATQAEKGFVTKEDIAQFLRDSYAAKFETQTMRQNENVSKFEVRYDRETETFDTYEDARKAMEDGIRNLYSTLKEDSDLYPTMSETGEWQITDSATDKIVDRSRLDDGSYHRFELSYESEEAVQDAIDEFIQLDAESMVSLREIKGQDPTQYSGMYTLPNGKNYEETVLRMPSVKYTSRHFSNVPNYVAHMRTAEHGTGLLIEELQSDLHSDARKKDKNNQPIGYKEPVPVEEFLPKMEQDLAGLIKERDRLFDQYTKAGKELRSMPPDFLTEAQKERADLLKSIQENYADDNYEINAAIDGVKEDIEAHKSGKKVSYRSGIADAPFRKDWSLQLFKRALAKAVATGKEWIGWTDGKSQVDRYRLSKQVDVINYDPVNKRLVATKNGQRVFEQKDVSEEKLSEYLGKDLAVNLLQPETLNGAGNHELSGKDLNIGGKGMEGFYDNILPKELGKYVKQWGGKVEKSNIESGDLNLTSWESWHLKNYGQEVDASLDDATIDARYAQYEKFLKTPKTIPIWSVNITPEMRSGVEAGQALFMPDRPTRGININDKGQDFTGQILSGEKTVETRDQNRSLKPYVGKRVGLISTGVGPAMLRGFADVGEPVEYRTPEEFRANEGLHRVSEGSKYDIKTGQSKFGYPLSNIEKLPEPKSVPVSGRVASNIESIQFSPNQPQQTNINDTRRRDKDFGIRSESAGDGRGPRTVRGYSALAGAPNVYGRSGPIEKISRIADQYAEDRGIPIRKQAEYVKVDKKRAERIAEAYAAMPHDPQNPAVKEAYEDLVRQTKDQYDALVDSGYEFYFIDPANDPYEAKPWKAMLDLRENERMAVFPTEAGFGSGDTDLDVSQNPLIGDSGLKWPFGKPDGPLKRVTWNDIFRAVHDAFGHGIEGAGFRADGEENAWQAHVRLFTGPAVGAMTSETRGQNSWLNFGPHAEKNKTASVEETVFADQKTGLMPEWTWQEGVSEDEPLLATKPKRGALEDVQLDVQFMAEKKKKSPAEKLQEKIRKAEKIDAGDLVSLPVLQEKEKGKLKFDKNGDPKIIEEGYKLLNSPEITKFSGGVVEDATLPEWDSLAYDVPKKAQKMIEDAILSGAIDAVVNRAVEKTAKYLENPEIAAGMGWYSRMRENLLNALGVEKREILSQLLGATSAKTPVNENFLQAMDALEGILSGRYDSNRKSYLEMMAAEEKADLNSLIKKERYVEKIEDKIKQLEVDAKKLSGKKQKQAKTEISKLKELISVPEDSRTKKQRLKIAVFGGDIMPLRSNGKKFNANSMAVMKVIAGTWIDNRKAPKTPNFAGNLSGRTVQATIDVWAARFLRQMLYERSGKPWRIQPKSETGVTNQDFALGQVIMERMAKKLKMNPDDLQAVLWFAEKDNWEKQGWTKNEGAEKSSFDEIFHKFFPKGKKPLTFKEAMEMFAKEKTELKEAEETYEEDDEEF